MTTPVTTTTPSARYGAVLGLLTAAAAIGDMWIQNDNCARIKGAHDDAPVTTTDEQTGIETIHKTNAGRRACAHHVATYTATQGIALLAGNKALDLNLRPTRVAAALAVSALTHYIADRRRPMQRLADAAGKGNFYRINSGGMNGAFQLDQAWHRGWEAVAAIVAAR